jgi:hypothetical protein
MILSLFIQALFYFLLFSKCQGALSARSKLSASERSKIDDKFGNYHDMNVMFEDKPHLRLAIVETALNGKFKEYERRILSGIYTFGILGIIDHDRGEYMKYYLDSDININFNYYFERHYAISTVHIFKLYENDFNFMVRTYNLTPLQLAVAKNRIDIVKEMVNKTLVNKLELDAPHKERPYVNARSIARKIYDPASRAAMLRVLKIDTEKHSDTIVKRNLKGELDISVKEAVMANNIHMVESALFLGNFGEKDDIHIIRRAMLNENYDILEMLVMEGYAIPNKDNRPIYTTMNKEKVDFILNQAKGQEHPSPQWDSIFPIYRDFSNIHCFE